MIKRLWKGKGCIQTVVTLITDSFVNQILKVRKPGLKMSVYTAIAVLFSFVFISSTSLSAEPVSPTEFVTSANADILKAVNNSGSKESISKVIEKYFDYTYLGKKALKRTWYTLKRSQQVSFSEQFAQLHRFSFQPKAVERAKLQTQYGKESIFRKNATVSTTVRSRTKRISVEYKLYLPENNEWRIWDVIIDNVSLYRAYEDQFTAIIGREGYDGLMSRIRRFNREHK